MTESFLGALGWTAEHAATFATLAPADGVPGRLARPGRSGHLVLTESGSVLATVAPTLARTADSRALPTVGDWVVVRPLGTDWAVDAVLPRRTAIVRRGAGTETVGHVLAANVDLVFLAVPVVPEPKLARLERFLALAWESGATPVVLVTKADLADDLDRIVGDVASAAPGVDVHAVSAVSGDGVAEVATYLTPGVTVVLLGASGVGKSTLANRLLGADRLATTDIRVDGKGRHTTTHRELVPLPGGAVLIDTPGLRAVGLWDANDGVGRAFADVEELAAACRFNDCSHRTEPGCAVLAAVADGRLEARRVESHGKLQRELAFLAAKQDARLRSEQLKKWKVIAKAHRQRGGRK